MLSVVHMGADIYHGGHKYDDYDGTSDLACSCKTVMQAMSYTCLDLPVVA